MTDHVGVIRTAEGLRTALKAITAIEAAAGGDTVLANMALAARFITVAALMREESRGGHYRADFPKRSKALARRSLLTLADLTPIPERPEEMVPQRATDAGSLH